MWIVLGILVAILLVTLIAAVILIDDWSRDLSENYVETSPDAGELLRPIETTLDRQEMVELLKEVAAKLPNWKFISENEINEAQSVVTLIRKTRVYHFVDDVVVTIDSIVTGSIVNIKSKSRIGKGDLGQNPRNVKELSKEIVSQLQNNS